jgi:hypothetical protein
MVQLGQNQTGHSGDHPRKVLEILLINRLLVLRSSLHEQDSPASFLNQNYFWNQDYPIMDNSMVRKL